MSKLQSVLYVEDEPDIREITVLALRMMAGLTVLPAGDGAEALRLAEANTFDLLLLDRMLPDMDGVALLKAVRKLAGKAEVPAVMISGRAFTDEERTEVPGLLGEIHKPFQPETLGRQLQALWEQTPNG